MLSTLSIVLLLSISACPPGDGAAHDPRPLPRLRAEVSELAPDGRLLAIADDAHRVVVEFPAGKVRGELDCERGKPVSIAWRPDGAEIAVLDHYGFVRVFGVDRAEPRLSFATSSVRDSSGGGLRTLAWARGGDVLVTALGTPAELFDTRDGKRVARLAPPDGALITALDVSPDGELVAIGDESGRVTLWRTRTGSPTGQAVLVPRGKERSGVYSIDFHPDGARLAIGGGDCTARIWKLGDERTSREFSHCDDDIFGGLSIGHVTFSSDGCRLATTSFTWWATRVWDVESGSRIATYEYECGNDARVDSAFTPDGTLLVTELGGVVVDLACCGRVRHALEPKPYLQRNTSYRSAKGFAWSVRDGLLRVCDVVTGLPVLERPVARN